MLQHFCVDINKFYLSNLKYVQSENKLQIETLFFH